MGAGRIFGEVDVVFVDPSGAIYTSMTRQPLAGATVWLFHNGAERNDPTWFAPGSDQSSAQTGADGGHSFLLQSPAQSGTYSIHVTKNAFVNSQLIPASCWAYGRDCGSECCPQTGDPTTHYRAVNFVITDWTDAQTLSQGVVHNHIPLDPTGLLPNIRVKKTADTTGVHPPARIGV